ncbi:MAG: CRISPR-associated endonuclease Cas2 [Gammaproteobacteria bacterium]|nr:CRISPR-associated endonuclease Cas2 [Gammaproteobacteria bacterium]
MMWIFCYDIENDRKRQEVFRLLSANGTPLQYSVFEILQSTAQVHRLFLSCQYIIDEHDSLRVYPACRWCRQNIIKLGIRKGYTELPDYFIV